MSNSSVVGMLMNNLHNQICSLSKTDIKGLIPINPVSEFPAMAPCPAPGACARPAQPPHPSGELIASFASPYHSWQLKSIEMTRRQTMVKVASSYSSLV